VLLIAYMGPYSPEINFSSSFFLHFWQGDSRKSQDLPWAACSVPRKSDQAATNSEFCWMQGPGTQCGLSIGFDAFLLSFKTNRVLLFTVSLCLCPPGQNSGISNIAKRLGALSNRPGWSGVPPNRPVWSGPAVDDPKLEQSRVMDTRSIRRLEYVRMVYFWTVTP